MPAPAAPAAPKIKVPSIASMTVTPAAGDAPTNPPVTPETPVLKAGDPPPVTPQPPAPPVLDTDIVKAAAKPGGAPVGTVKAAADFKAERLAGKQEKLDLAQVQQQYDQAKMELLQRNLEFEKLQKELADDRKKLEDERKLAETRKKDLESLQAGYFEQHRATWNPLEDQEFQAAQRQMLETLRTKLPMRVPGAPDANGQAQERRVFFDAILQQNGAHQGLANMLDAYAVAKQHGNEDGMNKTVNAVAQFLGADVDMTNPEKPRLLDTSHPVFKQIETALEEAVPHHIQRTQRYSQVQKDGPKLAKQQFEQREGSIRQMLSADIFLPPDVAVTRLKADPQDSTALIGMLFSQVPTLKDEAERRLNEFSQAYAAMGDRLFLPGLASANPAEIAAHRQREAAVRQTLSEAMRFAVVGSVMGPVLASVIAERDAAEERAQAAALLTNPGSGPAGREVRPPAPTLDTEIVTGR